MQNHGGQVQEAYNPSSTSHIFVKKGLQRDKLLKSIGQDRLTGKVVVLHVEWLTACLRKKDLVPSLGFEACQQSSITEPDLGSLSDPSVSLPDNDHVEDKIQSQCSDTQQEENTKVVTKKRKYDDRSDFETNLDELTASPEKINPKSFVCSRPSSSKSGNFNKHITDKLQVLLDEYTSTQDRWRAFGYNKAIASISKYHKPLESYQEVLELPSVGERIAKKVWEIIETGQLERLNHVDPKVELLKLFTGVWGAGPKTAELWVARGFKTLDDLPEEELTFQQKIGVRHYDDINEKMPRSEVAEFEKLIRGHAEEVGSGLVMEVCGSYRRGRPMCGDIDILLSHTEGNLHQQYLSTLLNKLKDVNLITDDLITVDNEAQRKYMGMCKLPNEGSKYRRIDFIAAPYAEWPCALLHFTGSAHYNRSIRLKAKKMGMSLSEHALRRNVVRGSDGEKTSKGQVVPVCSESDIMKHLGLDYLEPTERDW